MRINDQGTKPQGVQEFADPPTLQQWEHMLSAVGPLLGTPTAKAHPGHLRQELLARGRRDLATRMSQLQGGRRWAAHPDAFIENDILEALASPALIGDNRTAVSEQLGSLGSSSDSIKDPSTSYEATDKLARLVKGFEIKLEDMFHSMGCQLTTMLASASSSEAGHKEAVHDANQEDKVAVISLEAFQSLRQELNTLSNNVEQQQIQRQADKGDKDRLTQVEILLDTLQARYDWMEPKLDGLSEVFAAAAAKPNETSSVVPEVGPEEPAHLPGAEAESTKQLNNGVAQKYVHLVGDQSGYGLAASDSEHSDAAESSGFHMSVSEAQLQQERLERSRQ